MTPYIIVGVKKDYDLFPFVKYLNKCGIKGETAVVVLTSSLTNDEEDRKAMNDVIDANIRSKLITISLVERLEDGIGCDLFLKGDERYTGGTVYHKGERVPPEELTGGWKEAFDILKGYAKEDTSKPFEVIGEVTLETNLRLLSYLLACSSQNVPATIILWSGGGNCAFLGPLKVAAEMVPKITTIGIKMVGSTAASIFLFGTARFLCPGTTYIVHHPRREGNGKLLAENLETMVAQLRGIWAVMSTLVFTKTNITSDILAENTADGKNWKIGSEDWERLGITTGDYEEVRDLL